MKKFLAIFLAFTMLLAMLTVPTYAAGDATATTTPATVHVMDVPTGVTTVTYNEKEYNVIRTVEDFLAMTSGNNYILANDIDFASAGTLAGKAISAAAANFILEGNGFALNNLTVNNTAAGWGLFGQPTNGSTTYINNLTVNVSGSVGNNSTGVLFGASSGYHDSGHVYFNNVIMNLNDFKYDEQNTGRGCGLFFAKPRMSVTFNNCALNGTFSSSSNSTNIGVAGFVGLVDNSKTSTITFNNCKATGTYNFTNKSGNGHALFVGAAKSTAVTINFNNCEADATINAKTSRTSAFVGYNNNCTVNYKDCTVKGSYTLGGIQSGCLAGQVENNGVVNFTNCTADATVIASANRVSLFVGQTYSSKTHTFTNCKASGLFVSNTNWNGAFMGVAGGSYNGDAKTATVTFNGCDTDVVMFGQDSVAAYVGANGGGKPTINFSDCFSNATIYSMGSASAWIAEINHEETVVNHSGSNSTTVVNSATFVAGDENDDFPTWNTVSAEALADGSYAYAVAEAQKAAGVADAYLFGQNIGTDAQPKVGGATVNKVVTTYAGTIYTNATGTETVASNSGNAKAYFQTATAGENLLKTRVIVAMSKANLDKIAAMEIKVTFTLADTTTKTLTLNKWDIDCYYSVYADNKIAEAEDGCVLLAITVKDIPTDQWAGTEGTVAITMTATDADGNVLPEYTLA